MIHTDTTGWARGSHKKVEVTCDFMKATQCRKKWIAEWKTVLRFRATNNKDMCLYCSRTIKYTGRKNPNAKYLNIDDNAFKDIDTEQKAYILGWWASDGHIAPSGKIALSIHMKDERILHELRAILKTEAPIVRAKGSDGTHKMRVLTIASKTIALDVCRWLDIQPGNKSGVVGFPNLASDTLKWAFLRGFFDGDGSISDPRKASKRERWPLPKCNIASYSKRLREAIVKFVGIPCWDDGSEKVEWWGANAIDFLSRLYDGSGISLSRKRDLYLDWCLWQPGIGGCSGEIDGFRYTKTRTDACTPKKERASDAGYDITAVSILKQHGDVIFYDTGIKVQPPFGWYFMLVPRSSISKTGYILANSVGIIDRTYTGTIIVPLRKIDPAAPTLQLPCRIAQLIPMLALHVSVLEVESLDETDRGTGGFGSTGV